MAGTDFRKILGLHNQKLAELQATLTCKSMVCDQVIAYSQMEV